jgi:AcrR family transcriptional regulator
LTRQTVAALKPKDLAVAKAMLQDPGITVLEVARRLGVAASTLYRHLPRARTAALDA